jgi:hypothetical protein
VCAHLSGGGHLHKKKTFIKVLPMLYIAVH